MEQLPADRAMLYSFLNTKLRDEYDSFDDLCDGLGIDPAQMQSLLAQAGLRYERETNRVVFH